MTHLLCREDAYLLEFDAQVLERCSHEGRPAVVLDRTAFYPEGGGQPWDLGHLDDVPVVAVIEHGGRVLHVLERPLEATSPHGRVDGARRRDHREQHHGQHLLSRALLEGCAARTIAFHLGGEETSIDLDRWPAPAALTAALRHANEIVWEGRPVETRVTSRAEALALGCNVPPEAGDDVRLVGAQDFDLQPCSGTHPRRTSEVGMIQLTALERYKGGARLRFVCGHRALSAFEAQRDVLTKLGGLLSAPLSGLVAAAEQTLAERERQLRETKLLLERAVDSEARAWLLEVQERPAVLVQSYANRPAAELRPLAQRLTALQPCVALLGTASAESAQVVVARSAGLVVDVGALLAALVAELGGKGGGRGDLVQGGGPQVAALEPALKRAAQSARQALAG